jgi:hypothetical protein
MVSFREILTLLSKREVEFIVVGGVAAVLQGAEFMTRDVDIVHRRTPENIQRLLGVLEELDARYRSRPDLAPNATPLSSAGHQLLRTSKGPLDLLGEIEEGLDYDALLACSEELSLGPGVTIRFPSVDVLIRVKERSSAPKDQLQLLLLRAVRKRLGL